MWATPKRGVGLTLDSLGSLTWRFEDVTQPEPIGVRGHFLTCYFVVEFAFCPRAYNLMELVLTHVILATVCGEGRLRAAGRYVVSAGSAGLPDQFQIVQIIYVFTTKVTRVTLRCNVFFYFFIPLSSKTPSFESFFGRLPARNALKTRCLS